MRTPFLRKLLPFLASIPLFHILAVLFGAPLLSHFEDTFVFAVVLSFFTAAPMSLSCDGDGEGLADLIFDGVATTKGQWTSYRIAMGACAGALVSVIVIPLDWDVWWQKWPIPCLFGIPTGALVGFIVARLEIWSGRWRRVLKHYKLV